MPLNKETNKKKKLLNVWGKGVCYVRIITVFYFLLCHKKKIFAKKSQHFGLDYIQY